MAEVPRMPRREEILEKALEIFFKENPGAPTPEEAELKEGNYWLRARDELMTGVRSELEGYLAYLEGEAAKIREELGIEEGIPEERMTELEDKLSTMTERYKTTKSRLAEAREEIRRIKEEMPPPPPTGLSDEQKKRLEDAWRRVFEEAGVKRVPMAAFHDELAFWQEELKDVERTRAFEHARREIVAVARRLVVRPPPVAPPPAPPPPRVEVAVLPAAAYLGPRTRRWEEFTCMKEDCWETVRLDRDLMNRVTIIPILKALTPSGPIVEPLCRFPPKFYYWCPKHRKEKFGYTGIYDYLAFALRESEIGDKMCVTKATFREVGLDDTDIAEVEREKVKYLPTYPIK